MPINMPINIISNTNTNTNTKKNKLFVILYNYQRSDYSLVKIMDSCDKAFDYICYQEKKSYSKCKMIKVKTMFDLDKKICENSLNVCYILNQNYNNFELFEYDNISSYVIISMTVC
jgi:hypothetical protein